MDGVGAVLSDIDGTPASPSSATTSSARRPPPPAGIVGVLVRTGKYRPEDEDGRDAERPRHVVDSVADLPGLLGL
jgi:hypothetical protein